MRDRSDIGQRSSDSEMSDITVVVNGDEQRVERQASLTDLLAVLDLDPRQVVVELNREIVRHPALGETTLNEGDRIELVHFVGGG